MRWSAAKEMIKTLAILALDVLAFFCVMALLVTVFAAVVVGVFSVLWFYFQLLF